MNPNPTSPNNLFEQQQIINCNGEYLRLFAREKPPQELAEAMGILMSPVLVSADEEERQVSP